MLIVRVQAVSLFYNSSLFCPRCPRSGGLVVSSNAMFFDLWTSCGEGDAPDDYYVAALGSYVEPPEAGLVDSHGNEYAGKRAKGIRELVPE